MQAGIRSVRKSSLLVRLRKDKYLYLLMLPGLLYFLVFKYIPMWGVLIAFKNYEPFLGFWASKWVGFENFRIFLESPDFLRILRNTLLLSLYNIIFFFPAPIIMALLLNEVRIAVFKRTIQTMVYLPHFVSMVIITSLTYVLLTPDGGALTALIQHFTGKNIPFLTGLSWFRPIIVIQTIWQGTGWGTVLFLAALAGVDMQLYEAAIMDGAGRWKRMWHVTLPSIRGVIVIMIILRMGSVLDNGFEQIYLMTNSLNRSVADVFDTYVYFVGLTQGSFSYATAVGLFKSIVSAILIFSTNFAAKKTGQGGLF